MVFITCQKDSLSVVCLYSDNYYSNMPIINVFAVVIKQLHVLPAKPFINLNELVVCILSTYAPFSFVKWSLGSLYSILGVYLSAAVTSFKIEL